MSIRLKLDGFDDMMRQIEKAQGTVKPAAEQCARVSANVMDAELKTQMSKAGVKGDLIADMPAPTVENDHGLITARVGYKKGAYDPKNLSTGYKVLFLNYGTPHRKEHGQVKARGFVLKAKRKAKPKIKKEQQKTLHEILKG